MVAYGFKPMFAPKILDGTKRQTIRAVGKRRHARPGEELQLYTGMRTRQCKLIARVTCEDTQPIKIVFSSFGVSEKILINGKEIYGEPALDEFAKRDGFPRWLHMRAFWKEQHGDINEFEGVLITWKPLG